MQCQDMWLRSLGALFLKITASHISRKNTRDKNSFNKGGLISFFVLLHIYKYIHIYVHQLLL